MFRERQNFSLIKLPNDNYVFLETLSGTYRYATNSFLFGYFGTRTKSKNLVISLTSVSNANMQQSSLAEEFAKKGVGMFDKVFILQYPEEGLAVSRVKAQEYYSKIAKQIIIIDAHRWVKQLDLTMKQRNWFNSIIDRMRGDNKFLIGQLEERLDLKRTKARLVELEEQQRKVQEEWKNLPTKIEEKDICETAEQRISQMKWIDTIEAGSNNSLMLLTKPMACTYVENIGKYISPDYISKHDVLYKIFKYQCLGKYFIGMPEYYRVESTYNIKPEASNKYPQSRVRTFLQRYTYFRGVVPHAGNGRICLGELSSAIGNAPKTGLDMLLMTFEVFLRSINLPDAAGMRFYAMPMGDANGNIEVWPFLDAHLRKSGISFEERTRTLDSYEEILQNTRAMEDMPNGLSFPCYSSPNDSYWESNLRLIKEREPLVYEEIIKRKESGARL